MRNPFTGKRLPADLRTRVSLRDGERIVAWATAGAEPVVATSQALYLGPERLRWDQIAKANWDTGKLTLLIESAHVRTVELELTDGDDLVDAVHSLVTLSVVVSEHVELGPGAGARLIARRDSDTSVIRWSVIFDSGLDAKDPRLRTLASARLEEFRQATGA